MRRFAVVVAAVACFVTGSLSAGQVHREADAHVHGHGTLSIATEGSRLLMRLESPGADIVGFEHAAETDQEMRAVAEADEKLQLPLTLFVLPAGAGCAVEVAHVILAADEDHDHEDEEHAEEAHEAEARHDEEHDGAEHSEVHAEYELTCEAVSVIDSIRFDYFDTFPGAESLQVNIVTEQGQSTYQVTRDDPVIRFPGMM
jgi:hypothetical protein